MNNWQKERNYRQKKTINGIRYLITIDSKDVEVTEEVFKVYTQMDRRERYHEEQMQQIPHVSLEKLIEEDVPIELYTDIHIASPEEILIKKEQELEDGIIIQKLRSALAMLAPDERMLIIILFFRNKTEREAAEYFHISQPAIHKRKLKILSEIKKHMEN